MSVATTPIEFRTNSRTFFQHVTKLYLSPITLLSFKLIIGFVSAYDIFLTIKYIDSLPMLELNPIGRWLMRLDSGPTCSLDQVACFVSAKFAGNFLCLSVIEMLGSWKRPAAVSAAFVVAALQLLLLGFLTSGTY
ncbi:MAG: hypothetical protein VXZ82_12460 [Planctomycetota bacterium]|nr:hypothetical protein [Planctomycetota bacterium]